MVTHDEEEYMGNKMVGEKLFFLYIYDGTVLDKNAVSSLKILFYFHTKTSGKCFTTKNWD